MKCIGTWFDGEHGNREAAVLIEQHFFQEEVFETVEKEGQHALFVTSEVTQERFAEMRTTFSLLNVVVNLLQPDVDGAIFKDEEQGRKALTNYQALIKGNLGCVPNIPAFRE
jgi:hypothetical protein